MKRRTFINRTAGGIAASFSYSQLYAHVQKEIQSVPGQGNYDVIVLGVGSMGSAACYDLAKKGYRVLGLEQFDIPHELGSHAGQSRIIRKAYAEHPDYVPLLERAYDNWKALESETGAELYFKTGLVYFGAKTDSFLKGVQVSSEKYKIPVNKLTEAECSRKYPQFNLPKDFDRLEEPDAGFLPPERCILLFVEQAILRGAVIRTNEKVLEWKRAKGTITVKTSRGAYQAPKLIITAGPWAGKMIPGYASKLTITRQAVGWMKPKKWDDFTLGKFPCWILEDGANDFYGFPILPVGKFGGPLGLKLALHYPGAETTDPDAVNRNTKESDEKVLIQALNKFMPTGYEATLVMKTCLYTYSPDQNFILDYLPDHDKDVVIATGFSGHGFKFASVVGEIMADLAMKGSTDLPIGFLMLIVSVDAKLSPDMSKPFTYTTRAQDYTAKFPVLTYVGTQINFWIIANILVALIIHFHSLIISEATGIQLSGGLGSVFLVAILFGILYGITLGLASYFIDKTFFRKQSLGRVILLKAMVSLMTLILILFVMRFVLFESLIAPTLKITLSDLSWKYLFYLLLVYYFFMTLLISFINQVNKKYGPGVLVPLLLGRYRNPKEEERIFMFMDLKSSTATAEELGHLKYSSFIRDCFMDINQVLLPFRAQVYQYVGDEIVVTWIEEEGIRNNFCVNFYFACQMQFRDRAEYYRTNFGFLPDFKAGVHSGKVTAVEIGEVKRDIAYHGDTLNTASRIQSVCNEHNKSFLVSEYLFQKLGENPSVKGTHLGTILLKGKTEKVGLVSVEWNGIPASNSL